MLFQGECPQYRTVSTASWRAKQVGQRAPWRGIVAFTHPRTGGDGRELLAALGGATVAWPLAARAQQGERVRRVGVLTPLPVDHPDARARHAALLEALRQLGWTDGANLRIEARWSAGDAAITRKHAAELVALEPDIIVAIGSAGAAAMLQATRSSTLFLSYMSARDLEQFDKRIKL